MGSPITITSQNVVTIADYDSWPGGGIFTTDWQLVLGFTWIVGYAVINIDWCNFRSLRIQQCPTQDTDHGIGGLSMLFPTDDLMGMNNQTDVVSWKVPVRSRYARMSFYDPCGGGVDPFRVYCVARSMK